MNVRKPVRLLPLCFSLALGVGAASAAELRAQTGAPSPDADLVSGLQLRGIGPAFMSGRIADVAVDPVDRSVWYVATASSGVWKTTNRGTTWEPVFDDYASYSTGAITVDPHNRHVVWLGTGENTSQRSVGWGDGVYKSVDAGRSWTNVGLETSEHVGQILIDPRDSNVVYVAAMGGLWAPGGERGLYKTTDGGATWTRVLEISENTGVADVAMDPRNPDVLYAVSYQRRRHVGILVAGGPESALWKSTDGGDSWRRLEAGLPTVDMGRIALAVSPHDTDVVYALIAAAGEESGFFVSTDRGESWTKRSDYIVVDPQYYGEIYPDPHRPGRIYAVDVWIHVTDDDGHTWSRVNSRFKHVDNHEIVFDPDDPDYLMVGTDGGLYESFDGSRSWRFVANLPLTQFYRVGIDDLEPFYTVYGGTQDNSSVGGPSRTTNVHGIVNSDWFITTGGDGFEVQVEPGNPNILYTQSQYAGIVRYDRASGEQVDIQPQPEPGEPALRWHWDSPLLISPHDPTRVYFAAQKLFRSDDRANSWTAVSPDLSRGLDRNQIPVMGRVWGPDAVWKNVFTSPLGTIVSLDESPLVEGLLYVGTDDGLIQVSEDGGSSWRVEESFPGVPAVAYVADVAASRHDDGTVYAVFNNHKTGDFAPYVARSTDRGRTWTNITADLPVPHSTWTLVEDHVDRDLLFVGTEFGLFFTNDGGAGWVQLQGGLPVVPVRDLEIQRREDDLVAATFGRGFYILDDYSPLRALDDATLASEAALFDVNDAWMFIQDEPMGGQEKGVQGDAFFTAPNPPFGAVFTYFLGSSQETRRSVRLAAQAAARAEGRDDPYPEPEALQAEARERAPEVLVVVEDEAGRVVRRVPGPSSRGVHRVSWDLRYASLDPSEDDGSSGPLAMPGAYSARLVAVSDDGTETRLTDARTFEAVPLGTTTLPAEDMEALVAFRRDVARLQHVVMEAGRVSREAIERLGQMRRAARAATGDVAPLEPRIRELEGRFADVQRRLVREPTMLDRADFTPPTIMQRVNRIVRGQWSSTSDPTGTHRDGFEVASRALTEVLAELRPLMETDLPALEADLEAAGAPWTPVGRLPRWP
jgi:photosystem II stability/assembly factor-like uncharacterized protein